jgi:hypothetical protein
LTKNTRANAWAIGSHGEPHPHDVIHSIIMATDKPTRMLRLLDAYYGQPASREEADALNRMKTKRFVSLSMPRFHWMALLDLVSIVTEGYTATKMEYASSMASAARCMPRAWQVAGPRLLVCCFNRKSLYTEYIIKHRPQIA